MTTNNNNNNNNMEATSLVMEEGGAVTSLEADTSATNLRTLATPFTSTDILNYEKDTPATASSTAGGDAAANNDAAAACSSSLDINNTNINSNNDNDPVINNNMHNNYFNDEISEASDLSDVAIADDEQGEDQDDTMNAAPMHLHALSRLSGDPRLLRSSASATAAVALGGINLHQQSSPPHRRVCSEGGGGGGNANEGGSGQHMHLAGSVGFRRSRSSTRMSRGAVPGVGASAPAIGGGARSNSNSSLRSYGSSSVGRQQLHHQQQQQHSHHDGTSSTAFSGHSHSSHDAGMIYVDSDLLLDRLGFIDLDPPLPHEIRCGPLAMPGNVDGKSNTSGLTPVCERLSDDMLEDCHAFCDVASMPSVSQSSYSTERGGSGGGLGGMRGSDTMSVGSLSIGSLTKGGGQSKGGGGGSLAGGSLMGDGENSVLLGTLDEEGEEDYD